MIGHANHKTDDYDPTWQTIGESQKLSKPPTQKSPFQPIWKGVKL